MARRGRGAVPPEAPLAAGQAGGAAGEEPAASGRQGGGGVVDGRRGRGGGGAGAARDAAERVALGRRLQKALHKHEQIAV